MKAPCNVNRSNSQRRGYLECSLRVKPGLLGSRAVAWILHFGVLPLFTRVVGMDVQPAPGWSEFNGGLEPFGVTDHNGQHAAGAVI